MQHQVATAEETEDKLATQTFYQKPSASYVEIFLLLSYIVMFLLFYFDIKIGDLKYALVIISMAIIGFLYPVVRVNSLGIKIYRGFGLWCNYSLSWDDVKSINLENNLGYLYNGDSDDLVIRFILYNRKEDFKLHVSEYLKSKNIFYSILNNNRTKFTSVLYEYPEFYDDKKELFYEICLTCIFIFLYIIFISFLYLPSISYIHIGSLILNKYFMPSFGYKEFIFFFFLSSSSLIFNVLFSEPFKLEKSNISLYAILLIYATYYLIIQSLYLYNEQHSLKSMTANFTYQEQTKSYQDWQAQNLTLHQNNNEFSIKKSSPIANPNLEVGKTYQIQVYQGKYSDYFIKPDAFYHAVVVADGAGNMVTDRIGNKDK
ncbi:hypothetical protein [Psychrobacter sp. I-STPA10]|uniref:hypothetical protein n=1 Tax=Psychrobacter sp. I-STPA10 TaxID=2585769 RepID=UPI001E5CD3E5|nr:hypothetical protein [Psychrobacter sp. I-STPA10]